MVVEAWGRGRPDYSTDVSRGAFHKAIEVVKYNEKKKEFGLCYDNKVSLFPWVITGSLAPNNEVHLIDMETGMPMPFTIPKGYDLEVIKYWGSSNQPIRGRLYIDGIFISNLHFVDYAVYFEQEVGLAKISDLDPTLSAEHTIDITIENTGASGAIGYADVIAMLRRVHSPEIKEKFVKCPFCGCIEKVPISATKVICRNNHLFIVKSFEFGR